MSLQKQLRRYIARPALQPLYRFLNQFALAGMNYGGAASGGTSGDEIPLKRLARMSRGTPLVVFDAGANVGGYVSWVLGELGERAQVHAFEPSRVAFSTLKQQYGHATNVHLVHAGLGAERRTATLFAPQAGSVLASVYASPGATEAEPVEIHTVDGYCAQHGISRIDLLKIDVEGAELDVLHGTARMLAANAIQIIQFEFGPPSIGSRTYFHDLFELFGARYLVYRLLPSALVPVPRYEYSLEVFAATNFVAVSRDQAAAFETAR